LIVGVDWDKPVMRVSYEREYSLLESWRRRASRSSQRETFGGAEYSAKEAGRRPMGASS